jgi:hypothetical protein
MKTHLALVALVACFASGGCERIRISLNGQGSGPQIQGSGTALVEKRPADSPFTAIEIQAPLEATITIGETAGLELTGDDNLLPLIETSIADGKLTVKVKDNTSISNKLPLRMAIVTANLESLAARGAATARISGPLESESLTAAAHGASTVVAERVVVSKLVASAHGASRVQISGKATDAQFEAVGASTLEAGACQVNQATVQAAGASTIKLQASSAVSGSASGASTIAVSGQPKTRAVKTTGVSSVKYASAPAQ